jgi:hypothetical protein
MKKLLPLLFIGAIGTANAQIVINAADFPTAGTTFWMAEDDEAPAGLNLGTASATPQTWDFSMLITDTLYQVEFHDPASVDPNGDFPGADIALDQFGGYAFADTSSNDVQIIGIAADFGAALGLPAAFEASVLADDPWKIFEFPSAYGTAYVDTAIFDFKFESDGLVPFPFNLAFDPDSIRVYRSIYSSSVVDAEGVLTDVLLNTHNVLRVFVEETSIDSIWGYVDDGNGNWSWEPAPNFQGTFENPQVTLDSNYRFIGQEVGYIVVEIDVDGDGNPNGAVFMSDPSECCSGVEEVVAAGANVLYPNPTNDFVRVRTGGDIYQLNIMDMSGKLLQSERLTIDGQTVELHGPANGLYVYQMLDEAGRMAHSGRLSVIK